MEKLEILKEKLQVLEEIWKSENYILKNRRNFYSSSALRSFHKSRANHKKQIDELKIKIELMEGLNK